jgi:hypothetical protein
MGSERQIRSTSGSGCGTPEVERPRSYFHEYLRAGTITFPLQKPCRNVIQFTAFSPPPAEGKSPHRRCQCKARKRMSSRFAFSNESLTFQIPAKPKHL